MTVVPATRALVTIIVLDQLPRNMFRGQPEAFRADALARAIAAEGLGAASGDPEYTRFAIAHRDIIARFGRLPHRNAILGRQSSAEEDAFLKHPGSSI